MPIEDALLVPIACDYDRIGRRSRKTQFREVLQRIRLQVGWLVMKQLL